MLNQNSQATEIIELAGAALAARAKTLAQLCGVTPITAVEMIDNEALRRILIEAENQQHGDPQEKAPNARESTQKRGPKLQ